MVPDAQLPRIPCGNESRDAAATPFLGWKQRRGDSVAPVSARKLAASLWQLAGTGGGSVRWRCGLSFDRLGFEFCSSLPIPNFEGATKWDCAHDFQSNVKLSSAALAKQAELFKSRKHVHEPETKMKYRMRKIDEERTSSMRTEHHLLMRPAINKLAKGVRIERRICKNIDKMNSALLRDIAEAKLSAMKLIRSLQKEKKAREELEGACYDLAREIEARKAEIWGLRDQQERIQLEVEEERKMLQMAEVWREGQAQMKLADVNFILEDKYAEVNGLIADLKAFLTSSGLNSNAGLNVSSKAEILRQVFGLVINQGANKGFKCSTAESDNVFAASKDSSGVETVTRGDDGEGSVNKMRTYMSNCNAASSRNVATEICSFSLMQQEVKTKGSSIMIEDRSTARRNPHVIRAMKGHVEWP